MVITRGVDRGSGLHPVNEVFCWGLGLTLPSRVNFNMKDAAASSSSRWQTQDARIDIVDVAAARCHNIALDRIGRVFSWGFGADNLGAKPKHVRTIYSVLHLRFSLLTFGNCLRARFLSTGVEVLPQ